VTENTERDALQRDQNTSWKSRPHNQKVEKKCDIEVLWLALSSKITLLYGLIFLYLLEHPFKEFYKMFRKTEG
jgi:hypothetical protein